MLKFLYLQNVKNLTKVFQGFSRNHLLAYRQTCALLTGPTFEVIKIVTFSVPTPFLYWGIFVPHGQKKNGVQPKNNGYTI